MIQKKTILHIPNVNSGESTKINLKEVDTILDIIGEVEQTTEDGIIFLKTTWWWKNLKSCRFSKWWFKIREKVVNYLRNIKSVDDMDLILALGMAKKVLTGRIVNMH